ncbi:PspC domain-containing protein [Bacteroidales bacterium OttesenSCG-928-J16]|nr:PspC domain-containing protein [Bacteroidales bacterium OttesenSCG-928-J16]
MGNNKKLTRSSRNNVIAGICAGLGEYFNADPVIFRIIFIVLAFGGGAGIIIYLILWLIIPDENAAYVGQDGTFYQQEHYQGDATDATPDNQPQKHSDERSASNKRTGYILGICMIGLGIFFLMKNFWHISFSKIWPVFLIAAGIIMIINYFNTSKQNRHEEK